MSVPERTSAEAFAEQVPGRLLAVSSGQSWKDLLVQIFSRQHTEESVIVPAVPEPMIVWILSGSAVVEERELGGRWTPVKVEAGDFYLTTSATPYELRWRATSAGPFETMHVYVSLPLFERAARDVHGESAGALRLREISGQKDRIVSLLLEQLRDELTASHAPSAVFIQGLAQTLAVHLVRAYGEIAAGPRRPPGALPAFKLRKVTDLMEARLDEEFDLGRFARAAGMSEFHFSRVFKKATGFSPSRYFIRLRMARARRLLRETSRSVIDIGLDVGYSSPSHFAQVFRREVGVAPTDYRG